MLNRRPAIQRCKFNENFQLRCTRCRAVNASAHLLNELLSEGLDPATTASCSRGLRTVAHLRNFQRLTRHRRHFCLFAALSTETGKQLSAKGTSPVTLRSAGALKKAEFCTVSLSLGPVALVAGLGLMGTSPTSGDAAPPPAYLEVA